jgi:cell division septation protein DedD
MTSADVKKEESPVRLPLCGESALGQSDRMPFEAAAAPSVAPKTTRHLQKTYYPCSLFLSSVPDLELAQETVSQWEKRGLAAYYVRVDFSRGDQYWVYAGCFENPEKAGAFKRQHELVGAIVKQTPYANMAGVYSSLEEFQRQGATLKTLGYSPYAVAEPRGKYRLLVGAFLQKHRAEQLYEELKAKGVETQVVQR